MEIKFTFDKVLDSAAIDAAIRSINIPRLDRLSFAVKSTAEKELEYTISILFYGEAPLDDDQVFAIENIIKAHENVFDWSGIKRQRASLFTEVDWRIQRAMDDGDDITDLIAYRRALRDITKQESPSTAVWPEKPW